MIEIRKEPTAGQVVKQKTPQRITVTMIQIDLDNGIDRIGIQEKYGIEKWEVTQMFQHPELKGRKAKKVRKLSFEFVDDSMGDPNQISMPVDDPEAIQTLSEIETIAEIGIDDEEPMVDEGAYAEDIIDEDENESKY